MRKGPAINYVCKKFSTTKKSVLYKQLEDYPLSINEYSLACDMINGLSITELSEKYYKTPSRISQWKREVCEKIQAFDVANLKR
jgi:hypothetical protein